MQARFIFTPPACRAWQSCYHSWAQMNTLSSRNDRLSQQNTHFNMKSEPSKKQEDCSANRKILTESIAK